jgi:hypothetical protein
MKKFAILCLMTLAVLIPLLTVSNHIAEWQTPDPKTIVKIEM